ncbi:MAG: hypothetical protein HYV62_06740 [Candidatus Rokubacteria bacterium]|nr:hypothetical protein [Candidatus Rokubacteria bacterium]
MITNPYRDATLPAVPDAAAARFGGREALILRDERLAYAELHRRVVRLVSLPAEARPRRGPDRSPRLAQR